MTETRNSSLEQLSTEELIARKRDIKREINLRIQRQHNFHAAPRDKAQPSAEDKKQAADLLAYVDKADYDNIEQIWKRNPDLMFVEIQCKDGAITTPLKRALYNIDTWTWKPFYEWIKQNKPDLEAKFLEQNAAQMKHIDLNYLQPLSDEYAAYETQVQKWYRSEICDADLELQWKKLCEIQRESLPFHMIREMCRNGGDFCDTESKFDAKTAPKGGRVYDLTVRKYIEIDSVEFTSRFGSSLGLVRGWPSSGDCIASGWREWLQIWWVEEKNRGGLVVLHDAGSIRQLCKVRTSDLDSIPALTQKEDNVITLRKK